jgi:hypothetical protein
VAIIAKDSGGGDFTPHPEGMHQAACCDVIDHGEVETAFGPKHKITIRWQSEETNPKGQRLTVQKRFTLSLHEKSALRADLQAWRGKPFDEKELRGFDVEKLIGANALISVIHRKSPDGKVWANVASIGPLARNMQPIAVDPSYVRQAERPTEPEPGEVPHDEAPHPADMPAFEPPF